VLTAFPLLRALKLARISIHAALVFSALVLNTVALTLTAGRELDLTREFEGESSLVQATGEHKMSTSRVEAVSR